MSVNGRKQKHTFFTVFMFFFSWRRIDFVVLTRKSAVAILQSDVRWHTRTFRFRPLSPLKFLFPLSDIILLIHSDLLWVEYRWKRPVYYLFHPTQGLYDVFGVEMLRTYVLVAVGWNSLSARRQKVLHLFRSFFLLGREKKLRYGRVLELFLYTEMAQYLKFICFAFKIMHLSMSSPRGGWVGHRVGILTFSKKNYQNPHPRAKNNCQN